MAPRLPVPSLTRTRQLARTSLAYGYFQTGPSTHSYLCPLDIEWHQKSRERGMAHGITFDYWAGQPTAREQIVARFAEHYRNECRHTSELVCNACGDGGAPVQHDGKTFCGACRNPR